MSRTEMDEQQPGEDRTVELLGRWYAGEREALEGLLAENLEWMRQRIARDLSPELRHRFESVDVVQDAAVRLLTYGPKFAPQSAAQFRALLASVLVSALRDRVSALQAQRRGGVAGERPLPDEGGSRCEALVASITAPDAAAERTELRDWIRVGLEFLDPDDREVIVRRQFDGESFEQVARALELSTPDAARMRFQRALQRLAQRIDAMQGALSDLRVS